MAEDTVSPSQVITLHCSGSGAEQWRQLGEMLGAGYNLVAPEQYGCKGTGRWTGTHAFRLADDTVQPVNVFVNVL
jgi:hypothetical protein